MQSSRSSRRSARASVIGRTARSSLEDAQTRRCDYASLIAPTVLKTRTLKRDDLQDFINAYHPENRHERVASERFRFFGCEELVARDKVSLDIFWLKDESLDNLDDLPPPDVLQQESIGHLEAALAAFRDVVNGLRSR